MFCIDRDRVEGLVDGIRAVGTAARKTLDIEAGPLLQALNIFNGNTEQDSSNGKVQ